MENASKALLIVGAILICIILISIGIIIINSTGVMTDEAETSSSSMAIQTFNSQFINYEGEKQNAGRVKALISKVIASNGSNGVTSPSDIKYVDIAYSEPLKDAGDIKYTRTYKVELDYAKSGYVNKVTITEAGINTGGGTRKHRRRQ